MSDHNRYSLIYNHCSLFFIHVDPFLFYGKNLRKKANDLH